MVLLAGQWKLIIGGAEMRIDITKISPAEWTGDAAALFIFEGEKEPVGIVGEDAASVVM
jgi:hypothetical protein